MTVVTADAMIEPARSLVEDDYGLAVADMMHLATHSNVLYRVDLVDGRRLVLRVGQPTANTRSNIDIEVSWLSTLVDDPRLSIANPVAMPDGGLVAELPVDDGVRFCVLFTWVPGEPMGEGAGTSGYRAMGRASALLHLHGDWRPPDPDHLRRWDRTFYYPAELEPVVIEDFRYGHIFDGIRRTLMQSSRGLDAVLQRRWTEAEPMVVHGDLHEWNIHLFMGRAWVIDFEDVMLALPAQDIATSLYGARTRPDLEVVVSAFREGYQEHRPWPVRDRSDLDAYWAARQVMLMNHAAQVLTESETRAYFARVMPWLQAYLAESHRSSG